MSTTGANATPATRSGPPAAVAVVLWVLCGLLVLTGAALAVPATGGLLTDRRLDARGEVATATVTSVDATNGTAEIAFVTAEGDQVDTTLSLFLVDVEPQGEVEVDYDPVNPGTVRLTGTEDGRLLAVPLAIVAGGCLLLGLGAGVWALLVHRVRRRRPPAA